jgi:hypothetical protein
MVEVPVEDMAVDADAIVRGFVRNVGTRWVMGARSTEPHTLATLEVTEWIKGRGGDAVIISERGGEYQGGGQWIDGTPHYRVSEEVIVFLRRDPESPGMFRTYAMAQGKFVVARGVPGVPTVVERDLSDLSFARWSGGHMRVSRASLPPTMQLDNFLLVVRNAIKAVRQ